MKATVLIVVHNYGSSVSRAVESSLAQDTEPDSFEVVVIDDGSTDHTPDALWAFGSRIRTIRREHQGLPSACNAGIEISSGEHLIRLDADDELAPSAVRQCVEALDGDPGVAVVYTDRLEVDELTGAQTLERPGTGNIYRMIAPGVAFRRTCLIEVGGYDNLYWEEHDLMIRLLHRFEARYLAEPLYVYYRHANSMTADASRRRNGWAALIKKWGIEELRLWGSDPELEDVFRQLSFGATAP